jgi:hypothetical protein
MTPPLRRLEQKPHRTSKGLPFGLFGRQLLPALWRDAVVAGTFALVGPLPGRGDPALRLKPIQRGIQRAGLDLQQLFRRALNVLGDRVAVTRASQKGPQNEEIEGASQEIDAGWSRHHRVGTLHTIV